MFKSFIHLLLFITLFVPVSQTVYGQTTTPFDDEFDGTTLNPGWQWFNEDPTRWSLMESPGNLRITGTVGEMSGGCTNPQNLLLQEIPFDNYIIETKLSLNPTAEYQQGGLILFQSTNGELNFDNYAKLDIVWGDNRGGNNVEFAWEQQGRFARTRSPHMRLTETLERYLRLEKRGIHITSHYSADGLAWEKIGSKYLSALSTPLAGIYAISSIDFQVDPPCTGIIPDIVTDFDYFRVTELPSNLTVSSGGWQQVNLDGFGDYHNEAINRMAVYNNDLYAGVTNFNTGGEVYRTANGTIWERLNVSGFGNANNTTAEVGEPTAEHLYTGTRNAVQGAEIWRCAMCDGTDWEQVVGGGLDDLNNTHVQRIVSFNNEIFATVNNAVTGVEVWKSPSGNPNSWTQTNLDGFGSNLNTGLWSLAKLDNYLYVSTTQWGEPWENGNHTGGEVWRTRDGSSWTQVNLNGWGDRENMGQWLESYNGSLYAHIWDAQEGAELWHCALCDGSDWTQLVSDGYGSWRNFGGAFMLGYQGQFYTATYNSNYGTQVWQITNGESWRRANTDGFGQSSNDSVRSGAIFNNRLYLGTFNRDDGGSIWMKLELEQIFLPLVVDRRE